MKKDVNKKDRKVYFHYLGCPKLEVDNNYLQGGLDALGISFVDELEQADAVIVSTCSFIEDARIEAIDAILEATRWKAEKADRKLYVTGCLSSRYGDSLHSEIPEVDGWFSFGQYQEALKDISSQFLITENEVKLPKEQDNHRFHPGQIPLDLENYLASKRKPGSEPYAYLKISEGCNRRCAYCAIPSIRGPYRSRPIDSILQESRDLLQSGVREIIVIAQEVNSYGLDLKQKLSIEHLLGNLSEQILSFPEKRWLRIMYTHPPVFKQSFVDAIADNPVIVPYLDFPIEHADDKVLEYMRRRTTWKSMQGWIEKLRMAKPEIALRTSIIVGHPGEGEKEFHNLLERLEETNFERLGVFRYSPEEGTTAFNMESTDQDTMFDREQEVLSLAWDQAEERAEKLPGKEVEMIIEKHEEEDLYQGRTCWDAPDIDGTVSIKGEYKIGQIIKGTIADASPYSITLQ